VRAPAHWGRAFGSTPAGRWKETDTDLDEIEYMDGTLFVRAALSTLRRTGRVTEDEEDEGWAF
jgi:hypothetical protein